MKKNIQNQALIIFGASGDLTYRKLLPAIYDLHMQKSLPENFAVLGVARTEFTDEAFREKMKKGIKQFALNTVIDEELDCFLKKLFYLPIETDKAEDYVKLKDKLDQLDKEQKTEGNYIFYLSTPPALYPVIPKLLASQGLNKEPKGRFRRLIIEKPFGVDYQSAIDLNKSLTKDYEEDQIYRIDHYLGKETVQNVFVTRFGNSIYEPLWNRNYIQHVEITSSESIGVENRGGYYDHAGALRDMVQNHLLQLVALVAMEPPMTLDSAAIRNEKLKVFQAFRPLTEEDIKKNVIRGQYTASTIRRDDTREKAKGYREENGVDPESRTETYFAMKFFIDNWRWGGVPFYVRSGKRLPTRVTEVVIHFKPTPQNLFIENKDFTNDGNKLVLRIQPDEGILLKTNMKVPGSGYQVKTVNMDFHYSQLEGTYVPDAYERLILDCMIGDSTLYIRGDALEQTWKFVQPILDFSKDEDAPLYGYPAGTWGPDCADDLIEGPNTWRYPCKNLSDDGIYCEL